jgi:hypothetical protein
MFGMIIPVLSAEIIEELLTAVGALILPLLGKSLGLEPLFAWLTALKKRRSPPSTTADLMARLHSASSEMDSVIYELQTAADERVKRVETLESSITELIVREKELKDRVEGTEGLSKATVNALAKIVGDKLESVEGPKRRRDYALFAAGVLVSAAIGIGVEATKPVWQKAFHLQVEPAAVRENKPGKSTQTKPQLEQPNHPH